MSWYNKMTFSSNFVSTQEDISTQIKESMTSLINIFKKDIKSMKSNDLIPFYTFYVSSPYFKNILLNPIPVEAYYYYANANSVGSARTNLWKQLGNHNKESGPFEIEEGSFGNNILTNTKNGKQLTFQSMIYLNGLYASVKDKRTGKTNFSRRKLESTLYHELVHYTDEANAMASALSHSYTTQGKGYYNQMREFNAHSGSVRFAISQRLDKMQTPQEKESLVNEILNLVKQGNIIRIFQMNGLGTDPAKNWSTKLQKTFLTRLHNFLTTFRSQI